MKYSDKGRKFLFTQLDAIYGLIVVNLLSLELHSFHFLPRIYIEDIGGISQLLCWIILKGQHIGSQFSRFFMILENFLSKVSYLSIIYLLALL